MPFPTSVRWRPHIWQAVGFWALAPIFAGLWLAYDMVNAPVTMACARDAAHTECRVTSPGWWGSTVRELASDDLAGASLVIVPLHQDRSFRKVELWRGESRLVLADFDTDVSASAVADLDTFLGTSTPGTVSRHIIATHPGLDQWWGAFIVRAFTLITVLGGFLSLARQTTMTSLASHLDVRRSRWPRAAITQHIALAEIAEVTVVTAIPEPLAATVASLPWRKIYRATALVLTLRNGESVRISDWCKRSHATHERVAEVIRGWVG